MEAYYTSLASISAFSIMIIKMEHKLYNLSTKTIHALLPQPWIHFFLDFHQPSTYTNTTTFLVLCNQILAL